MRKIFYAAIIALAIFAVITLRTKEPLYHTQSYVFGTLVDISIYGETNERATDLANHVLNEFQDLHQRLHAWKRLPNKQLSEIGEINQAFEAGKTPSPVKLDMLNILQDASKLSDQSAGLFNPAIGHLISAWGFQRDEFNAVKIDDAKIRSLVNVNPKMRDIQINSNTISSSNQAVKLDLGGYAKGYALDKAAEYLRQQGVKNALINIGGNIIALGQHGKKPWRVGIQHPRMPNAIATLDLKDGWAIGTSGDYQRYFMLDGKRYCHIIDPRTGYPVVHTQSVTVLVPPQASDKTQAGVLSDVASKPIFIATAEQKASMAQALNIRHYMVIDSHAKIYVSADLLKQLDWLTTDVQFTTLH